MKKLNRFLSIMLFSCLFFGTTVIIYAEDTILTEDGTAQTEVTAQIPANFTVTIPKKVVLEKQENGLYTGTLLITVAGELQLNNVLRVEPDSTLYQLQSTNGHVSAYMSATRPNTGYITGVELFLKNKSVTHTINLSTLDKLLPSGYSADITFDIELLDLSTDWKIDTDAVKNTALTDVGSAYYWTYDANDEAYGGYIINNSTAYYSMNVGYTYTDKDIIMPIGISGIGSWTGADFKTVTLPNGVTQLSVQGFKDCVNLTTINFPETLHYFPAEVFSGCTGLTTVTVEAPYAKFDSNVFTGCTNLTSIVLSGDAYVFADNAFANSGITSVTYKETVYDVYDEGTSTYTPDDLIEALQSGGCIITGNLFGN